jgi:hypothetical protein
MKLNEIKTKIAAGIVGLLGTVAWASPITPVARTVIPSEVQQIISVDYRTVKSSDPALALKTQVQPDDLKVFERALRGLDINPDRDLDNLTFASFRSGKLGLKMIEVASGSFSSKTVLKKLQAVKSVKYHDSVLYPVSKEMSVTFLDDSTLLLGEDGAVRAALNVRDDDAPDLDSNRQVTHMILSVEKAPVWSVLDRRGTQDMLLLVLGDKRKLPDFDSISNRVVGSHCALTFKQGVKFRMDVLTSDAGTSSQLSALLKMGILYKRLTAAPGQKLALENMKVNSDRLDLQMHFKADPRQLQDLLHAQFFAAVNPPSKEQEQMHQ